MCEGLGMCVDLRGSMGGFWGALPGINVGGTDSMGELGSVVSEEVEGVSGVAHCSLLVLGMRICSLLSCVVDLKYTLRLMVMLPKLGQYTQ